MTAERAAQRSFLETAEQEAVAFREQARQKQDAMRQAVAAVSEAELQSETARRLAAQLVSQVSNARNQITQGDEALASLVRESERLGVEWNRRGAIWKTLGAERGQISMTFESVTETLRRLESEIATMRGEMETNRADEEQARRHADQLRAEHATLTGRRNSLESLIREHSYSTDTVRKLFQSDSLGGGLAPVGTLADFLEVNGEYESVVDEFLRDELNYIVVKSWDSADEGMRLLKAGVDGRATFLVHPDDAQAKFSFAAEDATDEQSSARPIVPLTDCIRVLDGFGRSLEVILPKLREGYVAPDSETARSLALENPIGVLPVSIGRDLPQRDSDGRQAGFGGTAGTEARIARDAAEAVDVERELSQAETRTATLAKTVADLTRLIDAKAEDRRQAEKESANRARLCGRWKWRFSVWSGGCTTGRWRASGIGMRAPGRRAFLSSGVRRRSVWRLTSSRRKPVSRSYNAG